MLILAKSPQTFHSYFPLFDVDHLKMANCSHLTIVFCPLGTFGQALCIRSCHEDLTLTRKSHNCSGIAFIQGDCAGGSKFIEQTIMISTETDPTHPKSLKMALREGPLFPRGEGYRDWEKIVCMRKIAKINCLHQRCIWEKLSAETTLVMQNLGILKNCLNGRGKNFASTQLMVEKISCQPGCHDTPGGEGNNGRPLKCYKCQWSAPNSKCC